jgi:predicted anti-sigma-YlaC factor YlaD
MESVPRNVILDLLPAYIAGEASEETRSLVEEFAKNDPQIVQVIRTGTLEPTAIRPKIDLPDYLEMKAIKHIRRSIRRQMFYVALATSLLLLIPLVAMRFTDEVNWTALDFIVMGILLFGTGLTYVLISRLSDSIAYRAAVGVAVLAGFVLIWGNLAVGLIGSENNPANLLYFVVLAIGFIGAAIARFRPRGMMRALFTTAIAQALVPVIALIIWKSTFYEPPGIVGVFILNGFFVGLFVVSALLFRHASSTHPS